CGFFKPDEGQVLYRGRDIAAFSFDEEREFQRATGFIFQNGGLLVNTRIYDNVAMPLRYDPALSDAEIDAKVREALATVGMSDAADRFPWELTVARQKLCTLARALVRDPQVIFYDNFFKGTEPDTSVGVFLLFGIAAVAAFLIAKANTQGWVGAKRLVIQAIDGHNIKEQAPVRMNGIQVGNVEKIDMAPDSMVVEVHFRINGQF